MIEGIAHTALYSSCFEKSIQFYKDVFDARELGEFETDKRGTWLQIGKDILEIFESDPLDDGLFKHIAIQCDDTDGLVKKALEHGASLYVEPKTIQLPLHQPVFARIAFITGPAGEKIELFQELEN